MKRTARRKPGSLEAFEETLSDAEALVDYAAVFQNGRSRRIRAELRTRLAQALRIAKSDCDGIDGIESPDVFVVLKPGSRITREYFTAEALVPLLRQVFVICCAAIETYIADRTMELLRGRLRSEIAPELASLELSVGEVIRIEKRYKRRLTGLRQAIDNRIREQASPAPDRIAYVLKMAGVKNLWREVDKKRGLPPNESSRQLQAIVNRRNRIAHCGDRVGRGRGHVTVGQARLALQQVRDIVETIHSITETTR